jgi:GT2 family glycosyltransferase
MIAEAQIFEEISTTVYILLPVHSRWSVTKNFISCLKLQTYKKYCLILIDDGSKDNTVEMVSSNVSSLKILQGNGNLWWAGSLQKGIIFLKESSLKPEDIILIVNDDVMFENDFLEKALNIIKDHSKTLLFAKVFSNASGECIEAGVEVDLKNLTFKATHLSEKINCLSTRALFMRWKDLEEIGGFYPKLLPHYLSDYEFTIRAHRKGFKLLVQDNLFCYLNEDTTGYHNFEKLKLTDFLKKYFSNKSAANPVHWTFFVLLCCPKTWIPINIIRVWKKAFLTILLHALVKAS